ncbi:MAG: ATP-dependent Clp protease ATP-binding subunit ClpA [Prevotella sp.]|nr:ATP-dependent Clp protease ATP-binding subunit ClpA [Prevotella sp.]
MPKIQYTERAETLLQQTVENCKSYRHEFVTPEHMLECILKHTDLPALIELFASPTQLKKKVKEHLRTFDKLPENHEYQPELSAQMAQLIERACQKVFYSSAEQVDIPHLIHAMLELEDSWAAYLLKEAIGDNEEIFMSDIILWYENELQDEGDDVLDESVEEEGESQAAWKKLVTCMNDLVDSHNPLIGRESELERTIQVLCRREKNNPLHVGEPGVGKTALVYGLVRRIVDGQVPNRLKDSRVYQLDLGSLLAGTQYRGDFENRLKMILEGIRHEQRGIVYLDEIHNIVGAGAIGESSMDAGNMLKPYLEQGDIRFIGSTTYEEYNKYFSRSKGLVRRFQQIDILEPSVSETVEILKQLRPKYEEFHGVVYEDAALTWAVEASAKHISDRFLPDKAIDLIDEAGAAMEIRKAKNGTKVVDKQLITEILAKTCKVEAMAVKEDDSERLSTLQAHLSAQIYGQDEAIRQVVEAVQMSKAGLTDDDKPLASLLFVGPTGVGKTEVARVLARELGIELVRFDMSEYTEKHAVAKLIGSPAGYVGYEDGGLLTDAIRKTPNCVLLLDEIEKAHSDIYNILLQVMDYARLTDNKGRKADFRNVVLLMTSNAGAQYAAQASIGFSGHVSRGEAMLRQVKKTFKPEFLNRLSGTVVFNDMDRHMATLILHKKLNQLQEKLTTKKVEMELSEDALEQLLKEGFTREYGAREMDRVIAQRLKPLLMRQLLFGELKNGGRALVTIENGQLQVTVKHV